MANIVLLFSHAAAANCLVAGIPAAARAAHQVALAADMAGGIDQCVIAVPGGWAPSQWCREELARLAPQLDMRFADHDAMETAPETLQISGEALLPAAGIAALLARPHAPAPDSYAGELRSDVLARQLTALRRAGDRIIAATGKPSDGIVSRHINRPISRAISRSLLRFPGVLPIHATFGAAALGIAMAVCLFAGGEAGLVAGALLFQAASIVDGVDGEIARATFRSSRTGAMLDSLTDAATNLAFIAGLTFNLWLRGHDVPAAAGAAGLAMLAAGLFLIGQRARASKGPFTFDAVKNHFRAEPSRLKQWLTWLTMRDFYAAAAAVLVVIGFAPQTLIVFAAAAAGWLVVTIVVLSRTRGQPG